MAAVSKMLKQVQGDGSGMKKKNLPDRAQLRLGFIQ